MAKTTFEATLPNGRVITRTSETRTYTNVVVAKRNPEDKTGGVANGCGSVEDGWTVLGWCGRHDLADRLASTSRTERWELKCKYTRGGGRHGLGRKIVTEYGCHIWSEVTILEVRVR